jgi:hypothetical protein
MNACHSNILFLYSVSSAICCSKLFNFCWSIHSALHQINDTNWLDDTVSAKISRYSSNVHKLLSDQLALAINLLLNSCATSSNHSQTAHFSVIIIVLTIAFLIHGKFSINDHLFHFLNGVSITSISDSKPHAKMALSCICLSVKFAFIHSSLA